MKTVIFYFTGTGNSLWVAKKIAAKLGNTNLVRLPLSGTPPLGHDVGRIGLVFPVLMFGLPCLIEDFIKDFDFPKDVEIFAVATCGGMPFSTLKKAQQLFKARGLDLSIGFSIQMVNNCTSLEPALPVEKQQSRFAKAESRIDVLCGKITCKEHFMEQGNFALNWYFSGILHKKAKTLIPGAAQYFYAEETCNGCGICEKVCPVQNVTIDSAKPLWSSHCEQCYGCLQWCPKQAIQVKNKKTKERERYHQPEISLSEVARK
jgi:ferredoxin/flavodoxin